MALSLLGKWSGYCAIARRDCLIEKQGEKNHRFFSVKLAGGPAAPRFPPRDKFERVLLLGERDDRSDSK